MEPDEAAKEVRISLISALRELLRVYECDRARAEAELNCAEKTIAVALAKMKVLEVSAALARLRLQQLGVKNAGE